MVKLSGVESSAGSQVRVHRPSIALQEELTGSPNDTLINWMAWPFMSVTLRTWKVVELGVLFLYMTWRVVLRETFAKSERSFGAEEVLVVAR